MSWNLMSKMKSLKKAQKSQDMLLIFRCNRTAYSMSIALPHGFFNEMWNLRREMLTALARKPHYYERKIHAPVTNV